MDRLAVNLEMDGVFTYPGTPTLDDDRVPYLNP